MSLLKTIIRTIPLRPDGRLWRNAAMQHRAFCSGDQPNDKVPDVGNQLDTKRKKVKSRLGKRVKVGKGAVESKAKGEKLAPVNELMSKIKNIDTKVKVGKGAVESKAKDEKLAPVNELMSKIKNIDTKESSEMQQTLTSKLESLNKKPGEKSFAKKSTDISSPEMLSRTVYVRNLPKNINRLKLLKHFPTAIDVLNDPLRIGETTGMSRLVFESPELADKCASVKPNALNGHEIELRRAGINRDAYSLKIKGIGPKTRIRDVYAAFPDAVRVFIPKSLNKNLGMAIVELWGEEDVASELEKRSSVKIGDVTATIHPRSINASRPNNSGEKFKVMVRNIDPALSQSETSELLKKNFPTSVGMIVPVESNQSKGFAFVTFSSKEEFEEALSKKHITENDRHMQIVESLSSSKREKQERTTENFQVIVRNLEPTLSRFAANVLLAQHFPSSVHIYTPVDENNITKGFAFVTLGSKEAFEAAVNKKQITENDRVMPVAEALTKAERQKEKEKIGGSLPWIQPVELFTGERLNAFHPESESYRKQEKTPMTMFEILEQREWQRVALTPPISGWDEDIRLTEEGKLWTFPVTNEESLTDEHAVSFMEHVFLDEEIETFPNIPSIRHFMELVCVGLSKNAFMTIEEKRAHIAWFRAYFSDKLQYFDDVYADDVTQQATNESEATA